METLLLETAFLDVVFDVLGSNLEVLGSDLPIISSEFEVIGPDCFST